MNHARRGQIRKQSTDQYDGRGNQGSIGGGGGGGGGGDFSLITEEIDTDDDWGPVWRIPEEKWRLRSSKSQEEVGKATMGPPVNPNFEGRMFLEAPDSTGDIY